MSTASKTNNGNPAQDVEEAAATAAAKPARFISKQEVLARVSVSYPTIWQWMRDGKFPRSRELGGRVVWLESEVEEWMANVPLRRLKGDR
jgi:prophage regulatory protein